MVNDMFKKVMLPVLLLAVGLLTVFEASAVTHIAAAATSVAAAKTDVETIFGAIVGVAAVMFGISKIRQLLKA